MSDKSLNNKRIAKNSGFLFFRMLLTMVIAFYSSRVLLRELGISDYGLYGVIGGIVAMFGSLRGVFASSIQRFLNFEMGKGAKDELNKVFSVGVLIHVILSIVFLFLAETIGLWFLETKLVIPADRYNAANWVYQFSIFAAIVTILTVPYDAVIIANERMKAFAYISLVDASLKLLIIFLISYFGDDKLIFYAILIFGVSIVTRTVSWIYCRRNFEESRFRYNWDRQLFRQIGSFAGWNFLGNSAQTLSNEGVNMVLNVFGGTPVNAARSIAYQVRNATMQFLSNILMAVNPQMIKLFAQNREQEFTNMLFLVSKISFFVLFIVAVPIFFFADTILKLWLVNVPNYTLAFVQLILIYLLVRSFHSPIDTLFKATGKIRNYQIVDAVTLFLNLPLSYIFLKSSFTLPTVFVIMIFVECLNLISILYLAKRINRIDIKVYFLKVILPCISVSIVCLPLCYFLTSTYHSPILARQFGLFVIVFIIGLLGVVLVGFGKKEKKVLYNILKQLKTKIFR